MAKATVFSKWPLVLCCIVTVCSELKKLEEISVPSLGRPFSLGDLYDRRRDYIVQGPKLWNHEELSNYVETKSPSTDFDVKASQSINSDLSKFGLSASLKMSFMAGLISVSGSASYLDNRKNRNNVARVSLNYKSTSFTRRLRSELFAKVTFPEILKNAPDATDVVVAIQYGAGAIFTFEKSVMQHEVTRDVEGTLKLAVKKIPKFEVSGSGHVKIGEEDRKKGEKLSCIFHGDFVLKTHPGTYEDAIKIYKTLPVLLGENYENTVPIKVWLYPIEKLPLQRSPQVFYEIKESMISSMVNVMTDLEDVRRQCNDILDSAVSVHHPRIRVKVKKLHDYVRRYILLFKQKLATVAPEIRKGEKPTNVLVKMLSEKEASPFSKRRLEEWIKYYGEEVAVLTKIQSLPNYCRNNGDFSSKLLREVRHTVGLTLKLGTMKEDYLETLEKYLLSKQIEGISLYAENEMPPKWWTPGSPILADLFELSKSFREFYELRKSRDKLENSGIQFLVREENLLKEGDRKGINIELFEQGTLKNNRYELVSPPSTPKCVSKTHESIYLTWNRPEKGGKNIRGFKVIAYRIKTYNDTVGCKDFLCTVNEFVTMSTQFNVSGLAPEHPYYFTISAYTDLGETSVSEMSSLILTTKCSPGTYHVGEQVCKECAPGSYSDRFGMTFCNACPAGTYNPKYGAKSGEECVRCPSGTYNTRKGSRGITACVPCAMGTFSAEVGASTSSKCQQCPKGTFTDYTGAITCLRCRTNGYNPDTGKAACTPCPVGTESKQQGATLLSQCVALDSATVLDRKIDAVDDKVGTSFKKLRGEIYATEKRIKETMKDVVMEGAYLSNEITNRAKALRTKYDLIHGCHWINGEGISKRAPIRISHIYSKEACVYNCMKLKMKKFPSINGVTRKVSTRDCSCLLEMDPTPASTSRYQTCVLPK